MPVSVVATQEGINAKPEVQIQKNSTQRRKDAEKIGTRFIVPLLASNIGEEINTKMRSRKGSENSAQL